jgi:multidrug resistance efflux pump
MNSTRRTGRWLWVLGIVLLVGTAAGAGWVLNHAPANDTPPNPPRAASARDALPAAGDFVISIGHVDILKGLTPLHPAVAGEVTEILVDEGDTVARDQPLLRLDDRIARLDLRRAQADLKAAEAQLKKVEQTRDEQPGKLAKQRAILQKAVEAAKKLAAASATELEIKRKLREQDSIGTLELAAYEAKHKAVEAMVGVEQAKLDAVEEVDLKHDIERAAQEVQEKKAQVEKADEAVKKHVLKAPGPGEVMRLAVNVGELLGPQYKQPAITFCPDTPRIIRAEVQQEFAASIAKGQVAIIEDDTRAGHQWKGRVEKVSPWYTHRRSKLMEPFQFNDVRTLEAIISVVPDTQPLRIGQRVRVIIRQGGP